MGVAAGYFYYTQIVTETVIPPIPSSNSKDDLETLSAINLDFSIFDNEIYKSLEQFGESPVSYGIIGRKDIFAPVK